VQQKRRDPVDSTTRKKCGAFLGKLEDFSDHAVDVSQYLFQIATYEGTLPRE